MGILGLASPALAGFRCTLGEWACTASCVTLGQTSGLCTDEGECQCSEKSISLSNLRALPQPHRVCPLRCRVNLQTRLPETRVWKRGVFWMVLQVPVKLKHGRHHSS